MKITVNVGGQLVEAEQVGYDEKYNLPRVKLPNGRIVLRRPIGTSAALGSSGIFSIELDFTDLEKAKSMSLDLKIGVKFRILHDSSQGEEVKVSSSSKEELIRFLEMYCEGDPESLEELTQEINYEGASNFSVKKKTVESAAKAVVAKLLDI